MHAHPTPPRPTGHTSPQYAFEPGGQTALVEHTDAAELSFMVALSSPAGKSAGKAAEYTGGGTRFHAPVSRTVQLKQGEVLMFPALLRHSGVSITAGARYLLVGFCHVDQGRANECGLVGLDFNLMTSRPEPMTSHPDVLTSAPPRPLGRGKKRPRGSVNNGEGEAVNGRESRSGGGQAATAVAVPAERHLHFER